MRAAGSSGRRPRTRSISSALRRQRHEVGLGEVAVIVRLLLRPQRAQRPGRRVVVQRLLLHRPAAVQQLDLALDLGRHALGQELERVHVLEFGLGAQLGRSPAGRTETLASQRSEPFSMSQSDDADRLQRVLQQRQERDRLLGRAHVGLGHDLDQRRTAAVEVDQREVGARDPPARAAGVHQLGRVLLEVGAGDARPGRRRRPGARGRRSAGRTG